MDINLEHKTAVVCGGTRGIGFACAEALASLGAQIVLVARNKENLLAAINKLPVAFSQKHVYVVADFSDPDNVRSAIHAFISGFPSPIHILVNNTGGPAAGRISEASELAFLEAFNAHLICNHILTMALIPKMKQAGYGRIINIISTSVKTPLPNLGVSNTIRAAVANWSKTMANELGQFNITVNNVLPGATKTERLSSIMQNNALKNRVSVEETEQRMTEEIPMKRFGEPFEVANAVAFLASPAAGYINGINLPVDGGRTSSL